VREPSAFSTDCAEVPARSVLARTMEFIHDSAEEQ